jgi:hypothetical protein
MHALPRPFDICVTRFTVTLVCSRRATHSCVCERVAWVSHVATVSEVEAPHP